MNRTIWLGIVVICCFSIVIIILAGFGIPQVSELPQTGTTSKYNLNVLAINYNQEENGVNLADKYFPYPGGYHEFERAFYDVTSKAFLDISSGRINYQVVKQININTFPIYKDGFKYNITSYGKCFGGGTAEEIAACETRKWTLDNAKWIQDNQICEIAEENNIDEIWMLSNPYITTYESFMIGPDSDGFWVNGPYLNVGSACKKHYIVMNANYRPTSPEPLLHIYGHRIESVMSQITSFWKSSEINTYWENFSGVSLYGTCSSSATCPNERTFCGNTHFPSNAERHYDTFNKNIKLFNCIDWSNFPDFTGATELINCDAWGCDDSGWQKYWFRSLPNKEGLLNMTLKNGNQIDLYRDWWYYILYPSNVIEYKREAIGILPTVTITPPLFTPTSTPKAKPTFTPTSTPKAKPTITVTPEITVVNCGPIDVNGDNILDYIDLYAFIKVYNMLCVDTDNSVNWKCGGKDYNKDGTINYIDLDHLAKKYFPNTKNCIL